jgi:hypothetical protein
MCQSGLEHRHTPGGITLSILSLREPNIPGAMGVFVTNAWLSPSIHYRVTEATIHC